MNVITYKTSILILIVSLLTLAAGSLAAQVYKTVDEDGNVSYTDQPPADGSQPIKLKEISVVETPTYETPATAEADGTESEEDKPPSMRSLRRTYRDFAIVAPLSEESVWHPEAPITVAWNTATPLQAGMTVSVSVDGNKRISTTSSRIPVSGLERGEHTVTAQLLTDRNQVIATAEPVTFFVRQPNIYTNRPRPRPGGGG